MTDQLAESFDQILAARKSHDVLNRLDKSGDGPVRHFLNHCISNAPASSAQLFQDLFVLFVTREKRDGFFVEFGATNGRSLSNTYLLEQEFGWTGILAEPAKSWHYALKNNRKAAIDPRCVWKKSGQIIEFEEARDPMFSGATQMARENLNNRGSIKYPVQTVSLNDLLMKHKAPRKIDYLSVDTEGSEYKILRFRFQKI
jgi:FkbM family methyltransferase